MGRDQIATWSAVGVLIVWGLVTLYAAISEDATVALAAGPLGLAAAGFLFGFRTGRSDE